MHLYELSREYQSVLDGLQQRGENSPMLAAMLDEIKAPLEQKVINIAKYTRQLEGNIDAIKAEIERLQDMLRAVQSREDQLLNYLEINMRACGIDRIESPIFKIAIQKNPPKVEITSEEQLPDEYKRIKSEVVIDKEKIKEELRNGVVIPGARLTRTERLVIK